MTKIEKKELRKLATQYMQERIYEMSDVFFQSNEVRKALIDCYESGFMKKK
jgi:hypothetical protein